MDGQELEEVKSVVEHAAHGNWFPFAIVCGCLGLCVLMFIFILRMKEKANDKKHDDHDKILKALTDGNISMNTMIAVHETRIENIEKNG